MTGALRPRRGPPAVEGPHSPAPTPGSELEAGAGVRHLDLTGVVCPLNWVRTRLALEGMRSGDALSVRLDPGEPLDSVARSAREEGHEVEVREALLTIAKR